MLISFFTVCKSCSNLWMVASFPQAMPSIGSALLDSILLILHHDLHPYFNHNIYVLATTVALVQISSTFKSIFNNFWYLPVSMFNSWIQTCDRSIPQETWPAVPLRNDDMCQFLDRCPLRRIGPTSVNSISQALTLMQVLVTIKTRWK